MTAAPEIKAVPDRIEDAFDGFMSAFEAFKDANDARLDEIEKKLSADVVTRDKVDRINKAVDEQKKAIDQLVLKKARPALGGGEVSSLEAMEHKKPVVVTAFGGGPEVVEDGTSGFVANPFDVAGFAERIARLLRDPGLAARMGEAGYLRLLQRFTIERLTAEFLEEYERARSLAAAVRTRPAMTWRIL